MDYLNGTKSGGRTYTESSTNIYIYKEVNRRVNNLELSSVWKELSKSRYENKML